MILNGPIVALVLLLPACGLVPGQVVTNKITAVESAAPAAEPGAKVAAKSEQGTEQTVSAAASGSEKNRSTVREIATDRVAIAGKLVHGSRPNHDFRGTSIYIEGDPSQIFKVDFDGTYQVDMPANLRLLDDGKGTTELALYAVQREGFGLGAKLGTISAKPGVETKIAEKEVKPLGSIKARVQLSSAADCSGVTGYVGGTGYVGLTGDDCALTLEGLPEGSWKLSFAADGYLKTDVNVDVVGGKIVQAPTVILLIDRGVQGTFVVEPDSAPNPQTLRLKILSTQATLMRIGPDPVFADREWLPIAAAYQYTLPKQGKQLICLDLANSNGLSMGPRCKEGTYGDATPPAFDGTFALSQDPDDDHQVLLTFKPISAQPQDPDGADSYVVRRDLVTKEASAPACSLGTEVDSFPAQGLSSPVIRRVSVPSNGATYSFCLIARDQAGHESIGQNQTIRMIDRSPPPKPTALKLSYLAGHAALQAEWQHPRKDDFLEFTVQFTNGETEFTRRLAQLQDEIKLADLAVLEGSRVTVGVAACDDAGKRAEAGSTQGQNCSEAATAELVLADLTAPIDFLGLTKVGNLLAGDPPRVIGGAAEVEVAAPNAVETYAGYRVYQVNGESRLVAECFCGEKRCNSAAWPTRCRLNDLKPFAKLTLAATGVDLAGNESKLAAAVPIVFQVPDREPPKFKGALTVSYTQIQYGDQKLVAPLISWIAAADDQDLSGRSDAGIFYTLIRAEAPFADLNAPMSAPGAVAYPKVAATQIVDQIPLAVGKTYYYTLAVEDLSQNKSFSQAVASAVIADAQPPTLTATRIVRDGVAKTWQIALAAKDDLTPTSELSLRVLQQTSPTELATVDLTKTVEAWPWTAGAKFCEGGNALAEQPCPNSNLLIGAGDQPFFGLPGVNAHFYYVVEVKDSRGNVSTSEPLHVFAANQLTIDEVHPDRGGRESGRIIRITGTGFSSDLDVRVGGVPCNGILFVDEREILCKLPTLSKGMHFVSVESPKDGSKSPVAKAATFEALDCPAGVKTADCNACDHPVPPGMLDGSEIYTSTFSEGRDPYRPLLNYGTEISPVPICNAADLSASLTANYTHFQILGHIDLGWKPTLPEYNRSSPMHLIGAKIASQFSEFGKNGFQPRHRFAIYRGTNDRTPHRSQSVFPIPPNVPVMFANFDVKLAKVHSVYSAGILRDRHSAEVVISDMLVTGVSAHQPVSEPDVVGSDAVGGLIGFLGAGAGLSMTRVQVNLAVEGTVNVGGMVGRADRSVGATDLVVGAGSRVKASSDCQVVGGVFGEVGFGGSAGFSRFRNLHADAVVECSSGHRGWRFAGGLIGYLKDCGSIENAVFAGSVNAATVAVAAGGIVGAAMCERVGGYRITNVANVGDRVTAAFSAGGLFGKIDAQYGSAITIENAHNRAQVSSHATGACSSAEENTVCQAGGLFGSAIGIMRLVDSRNTGDVSLQGAGSVGGLIAKASLGSNQGGAAPEVVRAENRGNISALAEQDASYIRVGGLFGELVSIQAKINLESLLQTGKILVKTDNANVGGIFADLSFSASSVNSAALIAAEFRLSRIAALGEFVTGSRIGGIVGLGTKTVSSTTTCASMAPCAQYASEIYLLQPAAGSRIAAGTFNTITPRDVQANGLMPSEVTDPSAFVLTKANPSGGRYDSDGIWIFDDRSPPTLALPPIPTGK